MVRAAGNAPALGTHLVRPAYKAAVLFELRARNGGMPWTCTTLPFPGAHCLANSARSARPVDIPNAARGRTCTCTLEGLSFAPLPWATRAVKSFGKRISGDKTRRWDYFNPGTVSSWSFHHFSHCALSVPIRCPVRERRESAMLSRNISGL